MAVKGPNTRRVPAPQRAKAAGRPAAKPAARSPKRTPRMSGRRRPGMPIKQQLVLTGSCAVLLVAALPTALMLSIALLPAICAFVVDRSEGRFAAISVGALNIAGTWPFLLMLWTTSHTAVNAMTIILDPFAWLIIYSAAAVGWVLYLSFPSFVSVCMSVFAGHRLTQLRQQQKKLIEEWGPEVASHHTAPHR